MTVAAEGWLSAAGVRRELRRLRPRRHRSALDWYLIGFGALMFGAMLVSVARSLALPLWAGSLPGATQPLALGFAMAVAALLGRLTGPLGVGAADSFWLLALPTDRAGLLRWPAVRLAAVATLLALVAAVALWAAFGMPTGWLVTVAAAPVAVVMLGLLVQQERLRPGVGTLATVAGWAWFCLLGPLDVWFAAAAALALLAATAGIAWSGLGRLSRHALTGSGRRTSALGGALTGVDLALLLDLVASRATAPVRSRMRGFGVGTVAVVVADVKRLARRAWPQLAALAAADVLLAVAAPAGRDAGAVVALGLVLPLALLMGALRTVRRAPGLARTLVVSAPPALAAGAVLVGVLQIPLVAVGLGVLGHTGWATAWWVGSLSCLVAIAGALRLSTAPRPDFSTGLVMTEAGPVAAGALLSSLRGFDLAAGFAVWLALGLPAWVIGAAALALVARSLRHRARGSSETALSASV